jgi:hypothetical protein
MTTTQYQQYIQTRICTLAESKHSEHHLQQQYIIGFLTAQLAQAMASDNHIALHFRDTVSRLAIGPAASG